CGRKSDVCAYRWGRIAGAYGARDSRSTRSGGTECGGYRPRAIPLGHISDAFHRRGDIASIRIAVVDVGPLVPQAIDRLGPRGTRARGRVGEIRAENIPGFQHPE